MNNTDAFFRAFFGFGSEEAPIDPDLIKTIQCPECHTHYADFDIHVCKETTVRDSRGEAIVKAFQSIRARSRQRITPNLPEVLK